MDMLTNKKDMDKLVNNKVMNKLKDLIKTINNWVQE